MQVTLGLLMLGWLLAPFCEAAQETLEPLADHLAPPPFTEDHEAWLTTVVAQSAVLTRQVQALPPEAEPSKVDALKMRLATLRAEWQDLEAHQELWEAYRQRIASSQAAIVQGGRPTPALNRAALIDLFKQYHVAKAFRDEAMAAPLEVTDAQRPSARQWEQLAEKFERLLRSAQTATGDDGALALHGRLLQGACYLFASVEHFQANARKMQMQQYVRGIRVVDWVIQHDGAAPPMPGVDDVAGYNLPRWPAAHPSLQPEPTITQARELLSDFCPWGAQTYRILAASGLMAGFDWRALSPYGSEKISVAPVPVRWLPQDVEQDMAPIITGAFAAQGGVQNFRWRIEPQPTYTVWFVSPRAHGLQASTVFAYALKVNKLIFAGPEALLIDELKGLAIDRMGGWFGQGSGIHWASGHAGNLLGISMVTTHWLDPEAGWTFLVKPENGPARFKPSGAFAPDWGDLFKGALMDVLKSLEKAEMNLLFECVQPNNAAISAAFGNPKTYNGAPMPGVIIRGDTLGWQDMPEDRYRRLLHIVRYYRFDPRVFVGMVGLSETPAERAARNAAQWEGTLTGPTQFWRRLPEEPQPLGTRIHLNDFSPRAQVIRLQFPQDKLKAFRKKAEQEGKTLRAELVLPGELAQLGPVKASLQPVSEDLHVAGVNDWFDGEELNLREGLRRAEQIAQPAQDPNLGGEATFILMNAPMLDGPEGWVDLYSAKFRLFNVHRRRAKEFLDRQGVKPPPLLPHLLTEYTVRILLESAGQDAGTAPEELATCTVRLLPRPGKPRTGQAGDFGSGYLMFKQRYDGPAPEIEDQAPALPLRRCTIELQVPVEIKKVHTYSAEAKRAHKERPHSVGTRAGTELEDWEGWERGGKKFICRATGTFSGNTFKGTWKNEKRQGKFHEVQTGTLTVTLGGPRKPFPPGAPPDRAVMIPTQVTSFQATLTTTATNTSDSGNNSAVTKLTMSGAGLDLHERGSTMLQQMGVNLRSLFEIERMQHRYGYATLQYFKQGPQVGSAVNVSWSKQLTYPQSAEQQTLTKTEGQGTCRIAFQFH